MKKWLKNLLVFLGVILAGCEDDSIDYFYKEGLDKDINKFYTSLAISSQIKFSFNL